MMGRREDLASYELGVIACLPHCLSTVGNNGHAAELAGNGRAMGNGISGINLRRSEPLHWDRIGAFSGIAKSDFVMYQECLALRLTFSLPIF